MIKEKKTRIFVFHYKAGPTITKEPCYVNIWAGQNKEANCQGLTGDNTGDNISSKNKYYSELTGLYWVWKNTQQEIVGSVHYRRFFTAQPEPFLQSCRRLLYYLVGIHYKRYGLIYTQRVNQFRDAILTEQEIDEILTNNDIILPVRRKLKYTVEEHYNRYHDFSDLNLIKSIIKDKYPDFNEALEEVLCGKRLYANNMMIMRRADFDQCMSWLFDILFEFEKRVNLDDYQGYQQRILGFMAERLLNVWFIASSLRIKELPVIYFKHFKYAN